MKLSTFLRPSVAYIPLLHCTISFSNRRVIEPIYSILQKSLNVKYLVDIDGFIFSIPTDSKLYHPDSRGCNVATTYLVSPVMDSRQGLGTVIIRYQ